MRLFDFNRILLLNGPMLTLEKDPLILVDEFGFKKEPMYFKQGLTTDPNVYLRRNFLEILKKAELTLPAGLKFKIWDGFRTTAVQQKLYDGLYKKLEQENRDWSQEMLHQAVLGFVAAPTKTADFAAPHNTGAAVDLTLVDADEQELPMGTPFDYFEIESYTFHFENAPQNTKGEQFHRNRMILYNSLVRLKCFNFPDEWWHFSYGDREWAKANQKPIIYPSAEEDLFPLPKIC